MNLFLYFRKKHSIYTGVDIYDTGNSIFSLDEQIERYARNYAFWKLQKQVESLDDLMDDPYLCARFYVASQGRQDALMKIEKNFNESIREKIYERVNELLVKSP